MASRIVAKALQLLELGVIRVTDEKENSLSGLTKKKQLPMEQKKNTKPTQEMPATKEIYTKGNGYNTNQGNE